MAYVPAMYVAVFLIVADVFFTAVRSTLRTGGDVATYVLLSIHEVTAVAEAVIIFAFFSYTVWFTAGLLGHLAFAVRVTIPIWFLRPVFIQMYTIYGKFISRYSRNWDDPVYAILFCCDILTCIALSVALMYTVACLSEKRMYAPYHREWRTATHDQGLDGQDRALRPVGNTQQSLTHTSRGSPLMGTSGRHAPLVDPGSLFQPTSTEEAAMV